VKGCVLWSSIADISLSDFLRAKRQLVAEEDDSSVEVTLTPITLFESYPELSRIVHFFLTLKIALVLHSASHLLCNDGNDTFQHCFYFLSMRDRHLVKMVVLVTGIETY